MSKSMLSMEEVIDLLTYLGASKIMPPKGDKVQFTCTVHNESNASAGVNIDYSPFDSPSEHYQVFNCFSCHEKGTLPWLAFKSLPDQFKTYGDAVKFLKDRYGVDYKFHYDPDTKTIKRYEDFFEEPKEVRHELPMSDIAPFKSGKQTFSYFFERGFDSQDVKDYMIGRDLKEETVTIPIFWEDKKLAGVIGRYIDPYRPKNMRFKVYDFPKSNLIYPLDKFKVIDDTLIVMESIFDVIMMRKWGYINAVSIMGNECSRKQADMIAEHCRKVYTLFDNDTGGDIARDSIEKMLRNKVSIYHPTEYPPYGKDSCEWGYENTMSILMSSQYCGIKSVVRVE